MDLDENNKNLSFVYFDTNVESKKSVKVISIILEELDNLKTKNMSKELIKRYKESLKLKQMNDSISFSPLKMLDEYVKYLLR